MKRTDEWSLAWTAAEKKGSPGIWLERKAENSLLRLLPDERKAETETWV